MIEIAVSSRARAQRSLLTLKALTSGAFVDQIEDHALGHIVAAKSPLRSMITADDIDSDSAATQKQQRFVSDARRDSPASQKRRERTYLLACEDHVAVVGDQNQSRWLGAAAMETRGSTRMLRCAGGGMNRDVTKEIGG